MRDIERSKTWNAFINVVLSRCYDDADRDVWNEMLKWLHLPMRRYLSQPLDAGVLHRDVRIKASSDGAGDEAGALLLEQLDQPLLLRHQGVNLCLLTIEKAHDGMLFKCGWFRDPKSRD